VEIEAHLAALRADGAQLAEAARAAGMEMAVPTCPGWTVSDLLHHIGGVHRWAVLHITTGLDRPTSAEEEARIFVRVGDPELLPRFLEGHAALLRALEGAGPDLRCWTFLPAPSPLAFWARRQAHETHIHRVDAEMAAGWPSACGRELGTDGIDELLNGFLARRHGRLVADPPRSLGVAPIDEPERSWTIRIEPDRRVVTPGIHAPDCTLRGSSADLYHHLWNRLPPGAGSIQVEGDGRVMELWRERATVRWS
jgi:uncharacterized protein (TIGR03083 family)